MRSVYRFPAQRSHDKDTCEDLPSESGWPEVQSDGREVEEENFAFGVDETRGRGNASLDVVGSEFVNLMG